MQRDDPTRDPMILILGAAGRVGNLLERGLEADFPDRVIAATREEIDLSDRDRVAMEIERLEPAPTVAINCAALTGERGARATPEELQQVHREGVGNLARACQEIRCRLIHLSTAEVFGGAGVVPAREEDQPSPRTACSRSRFLGELAATEQPDHLVLRFSLVCGHGRPGDPLLPIRDAAERGAALPWADRVVSPLFAPDLIAAIREVLRSDWKGVLHLANAGACTLSELAAETSRLLGATRPVPLEGEEAPAPIEPAGGANLALAADRFARLSLRRPRDWRIALAATLSTVGKP
jgi:dTDP-4-dehydrorhamnose reductase